MRKNWVTWLFIFAWRSMAFILVLGTVFNLTQGPKDMKAWDVVQSALGSSLCWILADWLAAPTPEKPQQESEER